MDQFAHYHELTRCLFEKIAARLRLFNSASQEICRFIDEEQGHYALMFTGWRKGRRILDLYLMVRLRDGKIWIEEDLSEEGIATDFLENGVPEEDIVLGFQPPNLRHLTEFAVA